MSKIPTSCILCDKKLLHKYDVKLDNGRIHSLGNVWCEPCKIGFFANQDGWRCVKLGDYSTKRLCLGILEQKNNRLVCPNECRHSFFITKVVEIFANRDKVIVGFKSEEKKKEDNQVQRTARLPYQKRSNNVRLPYHKSNANATFPRSNKRPFESPSVDKEIQDFQNRIKAIKKRNLKLKMEIPKSESDSDSSSDSSCSDSDSSSSSSLSRSRSRSRNNSRDNFKRSRSSSPII